MVTNNFKNAIRKIMTPNDAVTNLQAINSDGVTSNMASSIISMRYIGIQWIAGTNNTTSTDYSQIAYDVNTATNSPYASPTYYGRRSLSIGTGSVAATEDDYTLGSFVSDDDVTILSAQYATKNGVITMQATFQNISGENIAVREVGLFVSKSTYNTGVPVSDGAYLWAREVLKEAVVIAPGETASFSISFSLV